MTQLDGLRVGRTIGGDVRRGLDDNSASAVSRLRASRNQNRWQRGGRDTNAARADGWSS